MVFLAIMNLTVVIIIFILEFFIKFVNLCGYKFFIRFITSEVRFKVAICVHLTHELTLDLRISDVLTDIGIKLSCAPILNQLLFLSVQHDHVNIDIAQD